MKDRERVYSAIKEQYGRAAHGSGCCPTVCSSSPVAAPTTSCCSASASAPSTSCCSTPAPASEASCCSGRAPALAGPSLGCGRPLLRADLKDGEVVLDIGSGAGREAIAAATQVAPNGMAFGLDMTDDMLALALENKQRAGVLNVFFIKGTMENIPLPAKSVDVIISNCVINLSPDKPAALAELFRVLKPGGRLAISDTVARGNVPESAKANAGLWCECLSGSMQVEEYHKRLSAAGFENVSVDVEVWYDAITLEKDGWQAGSAFVSAIKPV